MKLKPTYSKKFYLRLFWTLFALPFITLFVIFLLVSQETFGPMPTFEDLENPDNNLASQVYSEDGELLGKYYYQNRSYVDFREVSSNIVNALIATEDIRFYEHSGIDARGLARVFFKTLLMGKSAGGGSTITQQLAKNLFPRDTTVYDSKLAYTTNLVLAKFKEWITAVKLERNYTKKEILVMYLNTVPFGGQSYGIKSAAKTYFNSHPDSLRLEEAATLVGLLKAPTRYSPVSHPERSKQRRNIVLAQMNKYNYITDVQFDSLSAEPLGIEYNIQDHNVGPATYFREHIRTSLTEEKPLREQYGSYESYQKDSTRWANEPLYGWCNKNKKPDGSNYDLYRDGIKIYTTINSRMQKYAEQAVREHLGEDLQQTFFELKENQKNAPFSKDLKPEQTKRIMQSAKRRTHRYYQLKRKGL
ncbi:MAG TPA: transglycosylase domain-containing protein, partial [Bacteroidales bacterium]|nr:transglycosylase domain-containing protein [Bacteroidales bacterium]